jgi:hypothetical protein
MTIERIILFVLGIAGAAAGVEIGKKVIKEAEKYMDEKKKNEKQFFDFINGFADENSNIIKE